MSITIKQNIGTNRNSKFKSWPKLKNHWNPNCTHCFGTFNWLRFSCLPTTTKMKLNDWTGKFPTSKSKTQKIRKRLTDWPSYQKWCKMSWNSLLRRRNSHWSTWVNSYPDFSKNLIIIACSRYQTPLSKYAYTLGFSTLPKMPCSLSTSLSCFAP